MIKNVGKKDKTVRLLIASVLIILTLTNVVSGTGAIVTLIISAALILTSAFGFCGLYRILGVNTCPVQK